MQVHGWSSSRQWLENVHLPDKEIHAFVLNQPTRWLDDLYPPARFLLTLNDVRNYFLLVMIYYSIYTTRYSFIHKFVCSMMSLRTQSLLKSWLQSFCPWHLIVSTINVRIVYFPWIPISIFVYTLLSGRRWVSWDRLQSSSEIDVIVTSLTILINKRRLSTNLQKKIAESHETFDLWQGDLLEHYRRAGLPSLLLLRWKDTDNPYTDSRG